MADRYWVGGTANWDGTAGTKWATTSGGAGGASVPTSADAVFFDANSGANTVTIATGNTGALSINCTGFTGTLAGTAAITVSGSVTLVAGMTHTYSGTLTLAGTGTLTSAGKTLGAVTVNGSGITVTLGDAFTSSGAITVTQGTFNTGNYNVTATSLASSNSNTRTINLGSSTVTINGSTVVGFGTNTNLTFNAGTSTIIGTQSASLIQGGAASGTGVIFYNVTLNSTAAGTHIVQSSNTFNNLSIAGPAAAGVVQVTFDSRTTINGTLSTTGTAGNRRVWFRGVTYGLAQTLTVNAAPSLTDADFRDIYVVGTAAPISGTRIGDLRGCRGITFSTPKTVYWNLAGAQNWSATGWADTSTGTPSDNFFPLAQDTATFTNAGSVTGTITMNSAIPYTGTVDMSGRTSAMTLSVGAFTIYGDWKNGSGTTLSGSGTLTYSGRNTQTITSAGKTFGGGVTVDSYGGSVELADALNIGGNTLTVTNGAFDTKNFNVTAGILSSDNSNVRSIILGSSTVSADVNFNTTTNLTFNAGTSQINLGGTASAINTPVTVASQAVVFYNVSFTNTTVTQQRNISGTNVFNNLTIAAPTSAGVIPILFGADQTITGTLTVAGATAVRRIFVRSSALGTQRTLSVGTLSATDCDFRDIAITGAAAGSSPTRAGNCGGNSGITFPAAKTVYWNLAGAQNWSATAWAPGSGGTPDINNFPLAQDTAVFDNTGAAGTVTINGIWNLGTFNASTRTSAMTLSTGGNNVLVYGDWTFGTGVTSTNISGELTFIGRGTQTIICNGVSFGVALRSEKITGTLQLGDALLIISTQYLLLQLGSFNAVTYNVTIGTLLANSALVRTLNLGTGTWTLTGTGTVWNINASNLSFLKGNADIVLSDTSTTARTFTGGSLSYNKLTIGGAAGTSTLTISGDNQFTEIASTKTVAHTIALGSTAQTFGKWTVTGTAGNVVTLTGTGTSHILAGACTSGIDYLAMGSIGFAATSPGEFYAGANSTGTAGAPVYRTAKPADSTRYWVGGTGNWSDTARWSTSSGGAGGASVPRSHDDVIFNSASNAIAYTATVDAVTGGIRMKSLTIAGPLVGSVTLAGSAAMVGIHGNVTLPATGLTRTYTGAITLSSNSTGLTFTTNGVALASTMTVNGVNSEWTLGSALDNGASNITITNGALKCATYNLTAAIIASDSGNTRTVDFSSGTISLSGTNSISFGTTETNRANLTVTASTSQINLSATSPTFSGNNQTFYNVAFTSTSAGTVTLNGANSFNNLSFTGITAAGLKNITLAANQTVTGTLTFSAGTDATMRHFCRSDTIGTTRTITAAAVSMTDVDFRDITIAGAAAPASGTRIGDCKGNSGITFTAATTRYWNLAAGGGWTAIGWAASSGAAPAINNFPLAQDTCVFGATGLDSGSTVTINRDYNVGTIDMSARTTNTMTISISGNPSIYGNWTNGIGTTPSNTGTLTFSGRNLQLVTNAGRTFTGGFVVDSPGGTVRILDAYSNSLNGSQALVITNGQFDANGFNVTLSGATAFVDSNNSNSRTIAIGSGTWTIAGSGTAWNTAISTNLTVTGTGTISLTSASAKTFSGGGVAYTDITLNQGGNGTLTVTGNNTFKTISSTAAGVNTISLGTTTQRLTTSWTATGTAGNVLLVTGSSASSPATLVFTGAGQAASVNYLTITGVRAYSLTDTWYAGANSTNNGSLGWIFAAPGGTTFNVSFSDTATGVDAAIATLTLSATVSDTATASDDIFGGLLYTSDFADTSTVADATAAAVIFSTAFSDTAVGADATASNGLFVSALVETVTGSDTTAALAVFPASLSELAAGSDATSALAVFNTTLSELSAAADSFASQAVFPASLSELAAGSDTAAALATFSSAVSETVSTLDASAVAASIFKPAVSEAAAAQDAPTSTAVFNVALSDSGVAADAATVAAVFQSALSDTAFGADALLAGSAFSVSVVDTASGSDATAVAASVFRPAFADTATGADAPAIAASIFNTSLSEIANFADAAAIAASTFGSAFSDLATGVDSAAVAASIFTPAFSDTITGTDATAATAGFVAAVVEVTTGTDALSGQAVFVAAISELAAIVDAAAIAASVFNSALAESATGADLSAVAASTFNATLSDTAFGSDALVAQLVLPASFSDAVTGADAFIAQTVFPVSVVELATGADSTAAAVIFVSLVSELVSSLDVPAVAASIFNPSVDETALGLDSPAVAGSTFNISLSDSGAITDLVVGGYLWNPVDDSQSPNWQNVANVQTGSWTEVNTTQAPGWQTVVTTQSPGWTEVNTTQGPGWVEIQT